MPDTDGLPYRYYVTYTALRPEGLARGGIDVSRAWPITDFDEVKRLADLITEKHPTERDVVITGWQRYEDPPT